MQQDIMGILELDYSFVAPPTLGQGYLTVNSRAEFYLLPNKPECPLLPDPLPDTTDGEMLQVFVDSYLPNSALYALYKGGYLQAELQDKVLPTLFSFLLDCCVRLLFVVRLVSCRVMRHVNVRELI
jgi:hypothetical protein